MNKTEAMQIIETELESFRSKSYSELASLIDTEPSVGEKPGPSGKEYHAYFPVDVPAGPSREANLPVYPVIHSNPTVFHLFD